MRFETKQIKINLLKIEITSPRTNQIYRSNQAHFQNKNLFQFIRLKCRANMSQVTAVEFPV